MPHPWEIGDHQQRWDGYLYPDTDILRNTVGARSLHQLRIAEDDAVELGIGTLRELGIPASYDLDGLRAIHRHLFQDIYEWAGDIRTVNMAKGDSPFVPAQDITDIMSHVAKWISDADQLRSIPEDRYPEALARFYHMVNLTHPFREGNGRTQREFFTSLAHQSNHEINWIQVHGYTNDRACIAAHNGDLAPLITMFQNITTRTSDDITTKLATLNTRINAIPNPSTRYSQTPQAPDPAPIPPQTIESPGL